MTVRQLSNGKWIADRTINGTRHTKTVDTEEQANYWDLKFKIGYGASSVSEEERAKPGPSLSVFIDSVFWDKKSNLRLSTKRTYEKVINRYILPALGNVPYNKIKPMMVQDMINHCGSRRSAEHARQILSSILALVVDGDVYQVNPASGSFTYPPANCRGDRKGVILSRYHQHAKLLRHVKDYHSGGLIERKIVLGLCFGLRPEEVYGLDVENIDFERRCIYVDQVLIDEGGMHLAETKTPKGTRRVPMSGYAYERMRSWDYQCKPSIDRHGNDAHPVLLNSMGNRCSQRSGRLAMRKLFEERFDDGERIPAVTQWSLRHSFGTAAIVDGNMDVNLLAEIMGHEGPSTTRRLYVKPQFDDVQDAMSVIDEFY